MLKFADIKQKRQQPLKSIYQSINTYVWLTLCVVELFAFVIAVHIYCLLRHLLGRIIKKHLF